MELIKIKERIGRIKYRIAKEYVFDEACLMRDDLVWTLKAIAQLEAENEGLMDALDHCGYDPTDCIDCGGPPHNEHCRFWKLRHLGLWDDALKEGG